MNIRQVAQSACDVFSLGALVGTPHTITGGLIHKMWRLETTEAQFALKVLNSEIMSRPTSRQSYLISEQIVAAFQAEGLPVIAALRNAGGPLLDVNGTTVMVFPWVDGKVISPRAPKQEYAKQMGALFGRIHHLNLFVPELQAPKIELISPTQWVSLEKQARKKQLSCAMELQDALPDLLEWSMLYNQSAVILHRTLVVSHRDLDQKNVLWYDDLTPLLIDWESAGFINPTLEAVDAALNWSGLRAGKPQQEIFSAFLQSYRSAGGVLQAIGRDVLHGCLGNHLNWLSYNIRRALGGFATESDEQALSLHQIVSALSMLRSLSGYGDMWARWVDENR